MNKSDTPETDNFKVKFKTLCGKKYWVPLEHSERLERELTKAREALLKIEEIYIDGEDTYEDWKKMGTIARSYCDTLKL